MAIEHFKPSDLALQVMEKFRHSRTNQAIPPLPILETLFECLFYTSMRTEESDLVKVAITFIDPSNPDPNPPNHLLPERWSSIAFEKHVLLDSRSLAKLSKAADPSCTTLAVYFDQSGKLFIWGMIDQAMHYQNFLNYEAESGAEQPGLFQVFITDIGTLNVLFDYELIATLKQNVLVRRYLDVFTIGPISKILRKKANYLKEHLCSFIAEKFPDEHFADWENFLDNLWIQTFSRLLLKIQNYKHGGAILITDELKDIDVKYKIHYERLALAMVAYAKESITTFVSESEIDESLSAGKKSIERKLYLKEASSWFMKQGISDEIKGCIGFIASQSCVDGVVLFNSNMVANGFGGVLKSRKMPKKIYISATATATQKSLTPSDPLHFGTRHRSMIAHCWNQPGTLGLVISQDGDIRVMTKIDDKLIMWENIKTQQYLKTVIKRKRELLE